MIKWEEEVSIDEALKKLVIVRDKLSAEDQIVEAGRLQKQIVELLIQIEREKKKDVKESKEEQTVLDLHNQTIKEAEEYIKSHIGEFSFHCQQCGAIVSSGGLPHWALQNIKGSYHLWSPELFHLVQKQVITLEHMAYVLRTSVDGLKYTMRIRQDLENDFPN